MDYGLRDRVAIVVGGVSGIGAAAAVALAREGCHVTIVDRRPAEESAEVVRDVQAAGRRARYLVADVRDAAAPERIVNEIAAADGRLDILVYSAGIRADAVAWKMTPAQWDDVIAVNLTGCFHWNRAAAVPLRSRGWGRIVNVASINGLRGKFGQSNYAASKGGMIALTKTLARELGAKGVTVNAVAPGMVRTAMTAALPEKVLSDAASETLVGRIAEPEDCAAAVAYLCSEGARHVTGHVLKIDGGQYL
ncbi:MAG TPA: SDR family NAD(P)-dependent oxidoreductase [Candidatus Eisenbacteria bacterium]|nr:SDR family NAD(P)-dependent oxidoreductase [Candidatus Eisenbacteria bacterium]